MKILIKVTKEVLRESAMCGLNESRVNENCAIANAVRKLFPEARVFTTHISWLGLLEIDTDWDSVPTFSRLPDDAQYFIMAFDNCNYDARKNMSAFSFEVTVPPCVIELIDISQAYKILSESKTLELISI